MLKRLFIIFILISASNVFAAKLNFQNVDIRSVIQAVSQMTGKNFLVDPRVKGKITVIGNDELSPDEVYDVFLSVLKMNGFSTIPGKGFIKIVPSTLAKESPVPVLRKNSTSNDQFVTRIMVPKHVNAIDLVPLLRPLTPKESHIAAYLPTNALLITDYAGNVNRIVGIVNRLDVPQDVDVDIVPLQFADAEEVVRIISGILPDAQVAEGKGGKRLPRQVALSADKRSNSILISGSLKTRSKVKVLISQMDSAMPAVEVTEVIHLNYANAQQVADMLAASQRITGIRASSTAAPATNTQADGAKAAPTSAGRSGGSNQELSIVADEINNSLIITAAKAQIKHIREVVKKLDVRRPQVLVEAIIAEISTDRSRELGLETALDGRPSGAGVLGLVSFGGANSVISNLLNGATAVSDGATLGLGTLTSGNVRLGLVLKALRADAATNILSTPSVTTLDNEEARIVVGENVPFVTGQFVNNGGATNGATNPFQTIERQDVGVTLKVKPKISLAKNTIHLDIEQEVSNVRQGNSGAADLITSKRSIQTKIIANNGEIIILGGLIDNQVSESEQKVPGLGDVPVLGALFRSEQQTNNKRNLMVFMRPYILPDQETTQKISQQRYSQIQAKRNSGMFKLDSLMPPETDRRSPRERATNSVQQLDAALPEFRPEFRAQPANDPVFDDSEEDVDAFFFDE